LLVGQSVDRRTTALRTRKERFADSRPSVAARYRLVTIDLVFMTLRTQNVVDNNSGCITIAQRALDGANEDAMAPVLMLLEPHRVLRPAIHGAHHARFEKANTRALRVLAGEAEIEQNKLWSSSMTRGWDTRAQGAPGEAHSELATMGAIDGAASD